VLVACGLVIVLTFVVLLSGALLAARAPNGHLTVSFLDVGQGDAIFIETPNGNRVLVDGGSGSRILRALSEHLSFFDRSFDLVVATHPDLDHIGGLPAVFDRYRVGMFLEPGVYDDDADYQALMQAVRAEGLETAIGRRGMRIALDTDVWLDVLFPDRDARELEANTGSLVMRLVYGETTVLLTGDAPIAIEEYLLSQDASSLQSTILKLGHHGSRTSTHEAWVGFVDPEFAVVSAGCDNSYGHPHREVLALLAQYNVTTLSTCTEGTITFESDGSVLSLR